MSPVPLATERTKELAEELLNDALELSAHERAEFVRLQCGDDQSLRDEVLAMLADYERMPTGFLEEPLIPRIVQLPPKADEFTDLTEQKLGRYEMRRLLGQGGMGQVWLAHDTKLNNDVAIKVLPYQFSRDADRLQRFQSEAQSILTLKHQNIVFLYDIDQVTTEQGELHYFVMELIEGQTLRQRLKDEGRLPWRKAVDIASQIAAALEAAHNKGVIHRDIKPENVMLCPDGFVKVLDFGLAKSTGNPLTEASLTQSGTVIGTLRYMSPEQARGQKVTTQTDIFSLGTVLYELLTGQPLFAGDNYADVSAAILSYEPPPLRESVPDAPPELERVVHQTLAKRVADRYQSARDLQLELQQVLEAQPRVTLSGQLAKDQREPVPDKLSFFSRLFLRPVWRLVLLVLLLVGAMGWLKYREDRRAITTPIAALESKPIYQWVSRPGEIYTEGKISPDMKLIAFPSTESGRSNIWVKPVPAPDTPSSIAQRITKDEFLNVQPLWAPNSDQIAYLSRRGSLAGIWRISMLGGTPVLLSELPDYGTILRYWSKNGVIYYEARQNLFAFELNSRQTKSITAFDSTQADKSDFSPSPDEKWVAYLSRVTEERGALSVVSLNGGAPRTIASMAGMAKNIVWHPDSKRLFFSVETNGVFQIFVGDLAGNPPLQLTYGETDCLVTDAAADGARILYGVSDEPSNIWGVEIATRREFVVASDISAELWPDVSPNDQIIAYQAVKKLRQGTDIDKGDILTKSLLAKEAPEVRAQNGFLPQWSPDGKHLAFLRTANEGLNLWLVSLATGTERQLTKAGGVMPDYSVMPYNRAEASHYAWSPDGRELAYLARRNARRNLWIVSADGSGERPVYTTDDPRWRIACPLWSSDGKRIAWSARTNLSADGKQEFSVWVSDLTTSTAIKLYQVDTPFRLIGWSPADQSLIIASPSGQYGFTQAATIELASVSVKTRVVSQLKTLPLVYYRNLHLSPGRHALAYVAREDDKDNLWVLPLRRGMDAQRLTVNNDPDVYFSGLAWGSNGQTIYFGRQSRTCSLSMLTNFK